MSSALIAAEPLLQTGSQIIQNGNRTIANDKTETVLYRRQRKDGVDAWTWPGAGRPAIVPAFIVDQVAGQDVASAAGAFEICFLYSDRPRFRVDIPGGSRQQR